MEAILIKTAQLLLSLSILVVLHEFGHFMFARLFKTRVEKFYLFFNPWFSLWKKKKGETEYGIGWIPLGGYVKISGMIDESMDKEQMKQQFKTYNENNRDKRAAYNQTEKAKKMYRMGKWRSRGVNNVTDELYDYFMNCDKCEACGCEFTEKKS